jgi:hypothetical protein
MNLPSSFEGLCHSLQRFDPSLTTCLGTQRCKPTAESNNVNRKMLPKQF